MRYYQCFGENSVIFSSVKLLDPYLINKIDSRFQTCDADALVLGQEPVLSLGFIDPRDNQCRCPNPGAFAVRKSAFELVGEIDETLRTARAADYVYRLEKRGMKSALSLDVLMPCTEETPIDITDIWMDGLLLDFKHGNSKVRKNVMQTLYDSCLHYNSEIGNYSRKKIISNLPTFLRNVAKYSFVKGGSEKSLDFYKDFTIRGCYRMEVRLPSKYPLVSIVIRTHKRPESLRKTLESLRFQDYKNLEIIVVEDGTPESEPMIHSDFKDLPIIYKSTGQSVGRAAAANLGFELANGEWINLLDDDDYLYPEHITVGVSEGETYGCDIVFLQSLAMETTITSRNPFTYTIDNKHFMRFPRIDPFTMCGYCLTPDNGVLFKKELLSGGIRMREDLGANEDWELWLQLMTKTKWTTVHYATCVFVNPTSDQEKKERDDKYREWRGKQFESEKLIFHTEPGSLAQYYLGLLDDIDALNVSGGLDTYIKQTRDYYFYYSDRELQREFDVFKEFLSIGKGGDFTASQFNKWFCATYFHFSDMNAETKEKEIANLRKESLPAYPRKKIHFCGFWPWFKNDDNFFLDVLNKRYHIEQTDTPDYLISSIFGVGFYEYVLYPCVRIFFSGENYSPDFNLVDYAMSYNPMEYSERYRYIPEFYVDIRRLLHRLSNRPSYEEALALISEKEEFCNFIYGDSKCCFERAAVFKALDSRKHVLSAGKWMNNTENGFTVDMLSTKDGLQRRCRFTIAVESYPHEGFVTEKLTDAFLANTIPIYYGDPNVAKMFNPKAFINVRDFDSMEELADEIVRLDSSPEEMAKMLSEPVFVDERYLEKLHGDFETFVKSIFDKQPDEAIKRAINGQPEVHQKYIAQLQHFLCTGKMK